jgi:hypothetical protein|tara:strand:- start:391 stop:771 length:381 start_codon:yes stop_codon:yes gene_type:complete
MSFASERANIEGRFNSNWTTTAIAWGNVDIETPNNTSWVRFNILNGQTEYRAINYAKRYNGIINIQIFVPLKTGTNTQRGYADTISAIFESQSFNDVVCDVASVTTVGTDDKWHQMNVDVPYWRDS